MSNLVVNPYSQNQVGYSQNRYNSGGGSMNQSLESSGIDEFASSILRHKRLILTIISVVTLSALAWQLVLPKRYSAKASLQVELIDEIGVNQAEIAAKNSQRIANEVKLHKSQASAERVVRDLNLHKRNDFKADLGGSLSGGEKQKIREAATKLKNMVEITSQTGSDLIEISVLSRSPEMAALIANQYPLSVQALRIKKVDERSKELLASLIKKQEEAAKGAEEAERAVSDYRIANNMLAGAASMQDLQQVHRVEAEAISASAQSAASASRSGGIRAAAGMHSIAGASSAATQALERQEADLASQLASKSQTFGSGHPEIVSLTAALSQVRGDLRQERARAMANAAAMANAEGARMAQIARSEASGDAARAGQLRARLNSLTSQAYRNIENVVELDALSRKAELAVLSYRQLTERVSEIRAKNPLEGVNTTIVSPASIDNRVVSPQPLKITMVAMLASSILAFLIAFAIDLFDNKLRTSAQIRRLYGLPTFGMLPLINDDFGSKIEESPVLLKPQSLFSEVARAAYFDLDALAVSNQSQTVLITSPLPGDGKSVVSVSLAAAAMAVGKRVAVLDLDLRKPGLIQHLKHSDAPDLIEILKGTVDFDKDTATMLPSPNAGQKLPNETEVDTNRIALISAARPVSEPAALVGSKALRNLLKDLKQNYDFIVINAPATLAVKDARTMCAFADQTVVVARWGRTTISQMNATMEMLGIGRVAGVLYDQVDYEAHARGRYGDAIQYYHESSSYYSDTFPERRGFANRIRRFFGRESYPS